MSNTKEQLEEAVKSAKKALQEAEIALEAFVNSAENNVFPTLDKAVSELEDRMRDWAFQDCQGAHNCGADEYTQEFIVDGDHYLGTLKVEYDRHDKTYYYIYSSKFSYRLLEG